ncbi:hypothetical protein FRC00_001453, partial [Tulasnella sp. 408]
ALSSPFQDNSPTQPPSSPHPASPADDAWFSLNYYALALAFHSYTLPLFSQVEVLPWNALLMFGIKVTSLGPSSQISQRGATSASDDIGISPQYLYQEV